MAELSNREFNNYEHRYTDGSVSGRGVGIGVTGTNMTISNICTIFSTEAAAAFIAATYPSRKLVLLDSASVISVLQSETPQRPWIQGILENMLLNTTFAWIPGHCGVPRNTTAICVNRPCGRRKTLD